MIRSCIFCLGIAFFAIPCSSQNVKTGSSTDAIRIVAVGDIMSHQTQIDTAYDQECDCWKFDEVFQEVSSMISEADLAVGNLETTLPGDPKQYTGYPQFGAPDSLAKAIKDIGFDVLSTANNHSCDKGKLGVTRTLSVLDQLGLKHLGTYKDKGEYEKNRILFVPVGNLNLAFLDYTYGTNGLEIPAGTVVNLIDKDQIASDITLAKKSKPDAIIVMYHYGTEYLHQPDPFQVEMVEHAFSSGADIVLGGHPHTLQKFGKKTIKDKFGISKERFYIYSLGNFISGQDRRYVDGGLILKFSLSKENDKLNIFDIAYEPVWVYIDRTGSRTQFRLLPVKKYLNNDQERKLPETSYQRMKQFYKDTVDLLGP